MEFADKIKEICMNFFQKRKETDEDKYVMPAPAEQEGIENAALDNEDEKGIGDESAEPVIDEHIEYERHSFDIEKFMREAKWFDRYESEEYEYLAYYYIKNAGKVSAENLGLKLVVISDTHGDLVYGDGFRAFMENVEEYDLCVILGDIYVNELDKICEIIPTEKIIALRGNHDSIDVYKKHKIKNISGKVYSVNGVKIAGIEGSNRYKEENAALFTHYESLKMAYDMPQDADILISHDVFFEESKYDRAHEGMVGLTYYIFKNKVKYHIHGHIHRKYHSMYENGTKEISVYGFEYIEL